MAYKPLEVDRQNMTIMGVRFPDLETLNRVSSAIGSNMFEGFEPTPALFPYIDTLIKDYCKLDTDIPAVAHTLAVILDNINYLHPFREGNGRTQRESLRVLALEKGYVLDLNPSDDADIYERYMSGTIDSDVEKLTKLIHELLTESDGTN